MTLEYRKGDLLASELDIVAHGCNTLGLMGAGIAKQFKLQYPEMFKEYQKLCEKSQFLTGNCFVWTAPSGRIICNLGTQNYPGANATLKNIENSFREMFAKLSLKPGTKIGIPKIGCGFGGLKWNDVGQIVERLGNEFNVHFIVFVF